MAIYQVRNRIISTNHLDFSSPGYNVMHVLITGVSPPLSDVNAAIADIATFYTSSATIFSSGTTIRVGERVLAVDTVPNQLIAATPVDVTGTGPATVLPCEVAMCVSWRTAFAGPRYRGRTYLGPLGVNGYSTATGLLANTTVVQAAGNALITALAANPAVSWLGVFHRATTTLDLVTSCVVDNSPDTQRRRGS